MSSHFTTAPDRANSVLFSTLASPRSCVVILGTPETGQDRLQEFLRSLTIEHVSVSDLIRIECERSTSLGVAAERAEKAGLPIPDVIVTAVVKKWFWSRRANRGFALTGFPTQLVQALIFDEWLEARNQSLDQVVLLTDAGSNPQSLEPVVAHYDGQAILARLSSFDVNSLNPALEALSA